MIPAGTNHNIINTGDEPMKLYTIYSPPGHPHGTIHKTKEEAMAAEGEHYNGDKKACRKQRLIECFAH